MVATLRRGVPRRREGGSHPDLPPTHTSPGLTHVGCSEWPWVWECPPTLSIRGKREAWGGKTSCGTADRSSEGSTLLLRAMDLTGKTLSHAVQSTRTPAMLRREIPQSDCPHRKGPTSTLGLSSSHLPLDSPTREQQNQGWNLSLLTTARNISTATEAEVLPQVSISILKRLNY